MTHFKYHIFFCLNADAIYIYMKKKVKGLGLNGPGKIRVNRGGCFDRCHEGPLLVIYPEAIWYRYIDESDIDEIIDKHLINGEVVKRLVA
jgi:(2Fe-2S) ferredoxin